MSEVIVSIGVMVFILLAKYKYKFPEYDPTADSEAVGLDSEEVLVITESET